MFERKVIPFPENRIVRVRPDLGDRPQKQREFRHHLRMEDLGGRRPDDHPQITHGPGGRVVLKVHQVWVVLSTGLLWVIVALQERKYSGIYPHHIWVLPYKSRELKYQHDLSEQLLRVRMKVWDEAAELDCSLQN